MNRLLLLLLLLPAIVRAEGSSPAPAEAEIAIVQVLALGPLPVSTQLLEKDDKTDEIKRALAMQHWRAGLPRAGQEVEVFGQTLRWRAQDPAATAAGSALWLWFVQLEADRFVEGKLHLSGLDKPALWREGMAETVKDQAAELKLATGSHAFFVLHNGRSGEDPVALRWQGRRDHDLVRQHTAPQRRISARQLSNAATATRLAISPDGRLLALAFKSRDDSAGIDLNRLEIRELASGRIVQQWFDRLPNEMAWSPDGRWLGLRQDKNLWLLDSAGGGSRLLLAEHEHLGDWRWHPDAGSILFQWRKPFDGKDAKSKRLRGLEDRWRTFRDNSQLYQVDVGSGLVRPLTALDASVSLHDIHPAGDRLLLSQREIDYAEPPHARFRLFELSLASLETRPVASLRQLNGAAFADQGYWLLAGPGLAGGDGSTLDPDATPNEYDGQLYLLGADGSLRSRSRDFDPAIGGLHRLPDGDLLLPVTEGDRALLYRYRVRSARFQRLDTGLDVMEGFVASQGRVPLLAVYGSSAATPQQVNTLNLERNRPQRLLDSAAGGYAQFRLGEVRDWRFGNRHGEEIDGRYYLPPDFDPGRRYPLIVYYYGGTTPVNRQFTGRYPFHLWAANGYVVYVLQPRGTIGYGQRTSSLHVNAWGEHAADDIIDGTRAFLAAHDFVDPKRVGNIGASYGGFMTLYLATRTDLFAASVSHAGISNLSGYWGQGWWGYGYSGVASRGSFPWNNRELYVERSPIYRADRIKTPLLLLTGDADTNVPPGESHTMYTALKLLGSEVELVEIPGQDHHILDREKRYVWWDNILAWYDRWLKDQPQWWYSLYPEAKPAEPPADGGKPPRERLHPGESRDPS